MVLYLQTGDIYFNSSMVRLKFVFLRKIVQLFPYFNSSMVRLKLIGDKDPYDPN